MKRSVTTNEAMLAFMTASICLEFYPGIEMLRELGGMCLTVADVCDAVHAMKYAPRLQRVAAALDLLRERRRKETAKGNDNV